MSDEPRLLISFLTMIPIPTHCIMTDKHTKEQTIDSTDKGKNAQSKEQTTEGQLTILGLNGGSICRASRRSQLIGLKNAWLLIGPFGHLLMPSRSAGFRSRSYEVKHS